MIKFLISNKSIPREYKIVIMCKGEISIKYSNFLTIAENIIITKLANENRIRE